MTTSFTVPVHTTNLTSIGLMQGKRTPCASPIAALTATSDHAFHSDAGTDASDSTPDSNVDVRRTRFVPKTSAKRPPRTETCPRYELNDFVENLYEKKSYSHLGTRDTRSKTPP